MKLNLALATAALTLLGASAQAQLTLTATQTGNIDPLNGYTIFSGFVSNPATAAPVTIDSSSITSTLPFLDVQADINFTDLIVTDPVTNTDSFLTLTPGGSHTFDDLFELDLTSGAPVNFTYQLNSGNTTVASVTFPGTSAVPEPGSIALLASSLVGGGLFVARRRRK